jgi:hypothetical protein
MDGVSLEQALQSHASLFFESGALKTWSTASLWGPFCSCTSEAHVKDDPSPVQHRLPSFFSDKMWDLSGDVCKDNTDRAEVKLPNFFLDRKWDLGTHSEAFIAQEEKRLSFTLKPSDRFGMVLEETPEPLPLGLLVVAGVDDWSAFAQKAAGRAIQIGDVILEVNGKRGSSSEIREALVREFSSNNSQSRTINLVVRTRPPAFRCEIGRATGSTQGKQRKRRLGFVLCTAKTNSTYMKVQAIQDKGLVPSWNASHGSLRICKGDFITHVNGISKDVQAMIKELEESSKTGSALHLKVLTLDGERSLFEEETGTIIASTCDSQVRELADDMSICGASTTASVSDRSCRSGWLTPEVSIC